jgi:hypothetical protein
MKQDEIGQSLVAAFAQVPDPRSRHGRRHPVPAVLALATAAMLAGARSLYAIAQWGRLQPVEVVWALGFTRTRTPSVAMLHYTFKAVDVVAFEAALQTWVLRVLGPSPHPTKPTGQARRAAALDGKALCGLHGEEVPGVRLVALYDVEAGLVLAQAGGQDQNADRQRERGEEAGSGIECGADPPAASGGRWAGGDG